jgi:hypothetical protein
MFAMVVAALMASAACHTDLGIDQQQFVCEDHSQCMSGWHCGPQGVCEQGPRPAADTGASDADPPVDATDDAGDNEDTRDGSSGGDASSDDADASSEDADASGGDADASGGDADASDPCGGCPSGSKCDPREPEPECVDEDVCISAGECDTNQFCTKDTNECRYEPCQNHGDRCELSVSEQNGFRCVEARPGAPFGRCSEPCSRPFTRSTCDINNSFCMPFGSGESFCRISQCADNTDCGTGFACRAFAAGFGQCVSSVGTAAEGDDCSSATCEVSLSCDHQQPTGDDRCRERCNPWDDSTGCASGEVCAYLFPKLGVCRERTGTQLEPYEPCGTLGGACADGSRCMPDPRPGETAKVCVPLCRMNQSGRGDCASVDLDDTSDAIPTGCNRNALAGTVDIGACTPQCSIRDDCREGTDNQDNCVDDLCRRRCLSDSDCGPSDSPWICDDNGLCN